ncbi:hypothetical protein ACHAWF_014405, partial [Thalassiosira exigua]
NIAENAGTNERFVHHVMTRVLDKINSLMEISDTQACYVLLGMTTGMCSDIFTSMDLASHVDFVGRELEVEKHRENKKNIDDMSVEDQPDGGEASDDNSIESFIVKDDHEDDGIISEKDTGEHASDEGEDEILLDDGHVPSQIHANTEQRDKADCLFETFVPKVSRYTSTCPIYRIDNDETLMPVPYPEHYRNRGAGLRKLNRWEYSTQVKVVKRKRDDDDEKTSFKNKRGRKKAKAFSFANPPPYPGKKPHKTFKEGELKRWKKKANRFAAHMLVLFCPEVDLYDGSQQIRYKYDWETFVHFANSLKNSSVMIDVMKYRTMQGYMFGWRTAPRSRAILASYRGQNRTIWSRQERDGAEAEFGKKCAKQRTFYGSKEEDGGYQGPDTRDLQLSNREQLDIAKSVSYSEDVAHTLIRHFQEATHGTSGSTGEVPDNSYRVQTTRPHIKLAEEIMQDVEFEDSDDENEGPTGYSSEAREGDERERERGSDQTCPHSISSEVDEYLEGTSMSADKNLAISLLREHFMELHNGVGDDYEAPLLLITGGPGVGKSFLVNVINGVSTTIDGLSRQLRMALFGVAAVNIDGSSLCSLMDTPIEFKKGEQFRIRPWEKNKLQQFKQMFDVDKIWSIVLDEISTVKPYMLGYLNAWLQQACGSNAPFEGKAVVLMGDFDQLPPAGGPSLPDVAMMIQKESYLGNGVGNMSRNKKHFEIASVVRQGVELFTKAIHIRLSTQNRSEDKEHTHLLQKMSERGTITADDLREYKTLSQHDRDFEFATILTTGNNERHKLNNIQARRWAVHHNTNAVRWKRKIREKTWKGKPIGESNVEQAMTESCFWELFVPGAMAFLTSNLNTNRKLANGVPVRYHSMSFVKPESQQRLDDLLEFAAPGEVVTFQEPPDMINVELFQNFPDGDDKARAKNEENRRTWRGGSITNDGTIVIPIRKCRSKELKWKNSDVRGGNGLRYYPSKVSLADHFPIELGFSVTIHNSQCHGAVNLKGRTIPKVILCISENPLPFLRLKWEGLYVPLSRVRHKDNIRLLVRFDDRTTMEYIGNLKKNKFIKCYFDGYQADRTIVERMTGVRNHKLDTHAQPDGVPFLECKF